MIFISFPFRAMSINHYQRSTQTGRRFITPQGKKYTDDIRSVLRAHKMELDFFFKKVTDKTAIRVFIRHYYKDFYTKDGRISSKCNDADNVCKIIQDTIFDFVGVNDKLVTYSSGEKMCAYNSKDFFTVCIQNRIHETEPVEEHIYCGL